MDTGYKFGEVMVREVEAIGPEASLLSCAKEMAEKEIGCLIVKENEKVVGIITEQDIARKVVASGVNPESTPVKEIMSNYGAK